jgi:hypothetical protein
MRFTLIVLNLTRLAAFCGAALTGIAMYFYPGGTFRNPSANGYSLFQNSLSDLGSTIAWNGQPNYFGALFFASGFGVLALAGVVCFVALVRVYSSCRITRWLARAASAAGILSCAGLIAAAVAPEDRNAALHGQFTWLACGSFLAATLLFALATAFNDHFRRRVPIGWAMLTLVLFAWILVGPLRLINDPTLSIAIVLQKVLGIAMLGIFAFQSYEAERALAGITRNRP